MKDIGKVRSNFPSLKRKCNNGNLAIFFDGPGASQMPKKVFETYRENVFYNKSNIGGLFETSKNIAEEVSRAREAMSMFFNCEENEVVFGANATTSVFQFSRALSRNWTDNDEVVVTKLDHFANVSPWVEVANDKKCKVTSMGFDKNNGTYNLKDFEKAITNKTKLVAVNYACNANGTINQIKEITEIAHKKGALVFVDAVHYAPHRLIDVKDLNCDFMVTSAYKFFGTHVSVVFGKAEHLKAYSPYKVKPATNDIPNCWETGTQDYAAISCLVDVIGYFISLSEQKSFTRKSLELAFHAIEEYENELSRYFLEKVSKLDHVKVHGITDINNLKSRTPTFALTIKNKTSHQVAEYLAKHGIFSWSGHFYAYDLIKEYNLEKEGLLRVGLLHYNTKKEIKKLISVLVMLSC